MGKALGTGGSPTFVGHLATNFTKALDASGRLLLCTGRSQNTSHAHFVSRLSKNGAACFEVSKVARDQQREVSKLKEKTSTF